MYYGCIALGSHLEVLVMTSNGYFSTAPFCSTVWAAFEKLHLLEVNFGITVTFTPISLCSWPAKLKNVVLTSFCNYL